MMYRSSTTLAAVLFATIALGDDAPSRGAPPKVNLSVEQQAVLRDYQGFEKRLAELGESLRSSDLDRANLLLQARSESQRQQVESRLEEIVAILNDQRPFADAVERQRAVVAHMEAILKILQTDAERDRLQARIKELEAILKDTNRVIAAQKDVRADTERGGDPDKLAGDEQRVRDAAGRLGEKIDEQDARRAAERGGERPGDGAPMPGAEGQAEGQPSPSGEQPSPERRPGERQPMPQGPGEQSPMPGEPSPMPDQQPPAHQTPSGQPSQGQPSQGQPSQGQPSQGQPSQDQQSQSPGTPPQGQSPQPSGQQADQTPGRQQLEQAQREMEQAIQELKRQNRDGASNEQDEAIAQLEAMKAQIEEILRQLREEEKELYLTMLEARFQEMLKLQLRINADTVRLDAKSTSERGEAHFTKSRDLSRQEQQNVLAAEKALTLLKEEGSSVAFPEAVEQLRSNMDAVALRLGKGDTGDTTQLIEKLIVESLEEMVLSLQKELEKLKQDQQQPPGQQGQSQDPQLVDQLAELKMIRSLQNQVNRLTRQIGQQVEGEAAQDADTLSLLQDLARRQQRIQDATYDLSTGKNQ